jgi:hypothetical protein
MARQDGRPDAGNVVRKTLGFVKIEVEIDID